MATHHERPMIRDPGASERGSHHDPPDRQIAHAETAHPILSGRIEIAPPGATGAAKGGSTASFHPAEQERCQLFGIRIAKTNGGASGPSLSISSVWKMAHE